MNYRLAALPPDWMESNLLLIEDQVGQLYMFDPEDESLERVERAEASALMLWYDLSEARSWYSRAELTLRLTSRDRDTRTTPLQNGPTHHHRLYPIARIRRSSVTRTTTGNCATAADVRVRR